MAADPAGGDDKALRGDGKHHGTRMENEVAALRGAMTTASEIKPCGCGGEPTESESKFGHIVVCSNRKCFLQTGEFPTKPMARSAWNRALSAPPPAVAPQGWQPMDCAPEIVKDVAALIKVELGSARTRTVFSDEGIYLVHFDNSTRQPNYWCGPITYAPEKSNG